MIEHLSCIETSTHDPYLNLAREAHLLETVHPGECILYLWQNERTVVIGRNQNAADECNIALLQRDGGHLARRLSGGGAVYHDLGNLNFTFLMPTADYDLEMQDETILRAVRALGVDAMRTGRNDLTSADGRKFSGHAYYHTRGASYHHGTLMVNVDTAPLARYLNVSPLKLSHKGVSSVRSRVVNLHDLAEGITTERLERALVDSFSKVYGRPVSPLRDDDLDAARVEELRARFSSTTWLYREARSLDACRETRFDWGTVRLDLSTDGICVTDCQLWSDGLEADALEAMPALMRGCPLEGDRLEERLLKTGASDEMVSDLAAFVLEVAHDMDPSR
jgi:lipoate-protein ligase A